MRAGIIGEDAINAAIGGDADGVMNDANYSDPAVGLRSGTSSKLPIVHLFHFTCSFTPAVKLTSRA